MRRQYLVLSASLAAVLAAAPLAAQSPKGAACSPAINATIYYGGTGIPTDNSYCGTMNGPTLALSATQRYTSPAPSTTGNGVYNAATGESTGAPVNAGFSQWNFDYFVGTYSGTANNPYSYKVLVDNDPSAGVNYLTWGMDPSNHDSSNLGYSAGFNPFASGTYTIRLQEFTGTTLYDEVAINVNVGGGATVAPEPASFALMAAGLIGIGGFARRRNKRNVA